MLRQQIFALRMILPGAAFTVAGVVMIFSEYDPWPGIGWRLIVGGPLLVLLGIYFWPRGGLREKHDREPLPSDERT